MVYSFGLEVCFLRLHSALASSSHRSGRSKQEKVSYHLQHDILLPVMEQPSQHVAAVMPNEHTRRAIVPGIAAILTVWLASPHCSARMTGTRRSIVTNESGITRD